MRYRGPLSVPALSSPSAAQPSRMNIVTPCASPLQQTFTVNSTGARLQAAWSIALRNRSLSEGAMMFMKRPPSKPCSCKPMEGAQAEMVRKSTRQTSCSVVRQSTASQKTPTMLLRALDATDFSASCSIALRDFSPNSEQSPSKFAARVILHRARKHRSLSMRPTTLRTAIVATAAICSHNSYFARGGSNLKITAAKDAMLHVGMGHKATLRKGNNVETSATGNTTPKNVAGMSAKLWRRAS
mmetsp:Transcript_65152/g.187509  ORF Transcript_65152/g.187509 Transcript_65152/m.187509 type:complete len:242 (-) Transcript_65152:597-1322(-)